MRGECAPLPPHCRHGDTLAGESTSNPYLRDAGPLTAFWPMKASFATLETRRRLRSPKAGTVIGPMFEDVLRANAVGSEDWMSPRATRLLGRVFLYVFIQPHSRREGGVGGHPRNGDRDHEPCACRTASAALRQVSERSFGQRSADEACSRFRRCHCPTSSANCR